MPIAVETMTPIAEKIVNDGGWAIFTGKHFGPRCLANTQGDAKALSKLLFGSYCTMPSHCVTFASAAEPMMWLLFDQDSLYLVNNSDHQLRAINLYFSINRTVAQKKGRRERMVTGQTGAVARQEIRNIQLDYPLHIDGCWACLETEFAIDATEARIHLVSNMLCNYLPILILLYEDFGLGENMNYVHHSF